MSRFPTEILEKIAFYACDLNVTEALKSHITKWAYYTLHPQKNLIYGDIQSGKTGEIIKVLKKNAFKEELKVLVIQNSLLVLNQYILRLRSEGICFQVIDCNTKTIDQSVILLMNNTYRYSYFLNLYKEVPVPILILDESDQTIINCPLTGRIEYHVTATPIYSKKQPLNFDQVIVFDPPPNYIGLNNLKVIYENDLNTSINSFLRTSTGIMLINKFVYIEDMKEIAKEITKNYPEIPIVLLSSEKKLYLGSVQKKLNNGSISKIIDSLNEHSHIIFIANRLSLRGLSYTSTDRSRFLTHQITKVRKNYRNFIQSLRICGVPPTKNSIAFKLIIESDDQDLFEKHKRKHERLKICILENWID
jgi:hypothetical protein